jgi:fructokinase
MRTLCVGEALVDLVCEKPVASIIEADAFVPRFGGATANVAVTAARHGGRVSLAGGAGDDPWGEWLRDRLAAEGVDLEFFRLVPGTPTPVAFVTVDAAAQPTFQVYGEAIAATISAVGARLDEAVERCDALFISSNTMVGEDERALTMSARERALDLGLPVVLDPNLRLGRWASRAEAVEASCAALPGAFLVKCNTEEAQLLGDRSDPEEAAAALLARGARHVVVTLGARGAILRGGGLRVDVPAAPADAVDTTGAGDVLMGVLLARLGETGYYPPAIAASLPEAVAVAARATGHWGAVG